MSQDSSSSPSEAVVTSRYLSFTLGSEDYAIPLLSVREVIALPEVTPIPFTPPYFLGIMNLRGQVISVIDLRQKLGIKPNPTSENAVIICDLGAVSLGVVVDSINSVLSPAPSEVAAKPEIQSSMNSDYITGVYKRQDRLVVFLDIIKTLNPQDQRAIGQAAAKKSA